MMKYLVAAAAVMLAACSPHTNRLDGENVELSFVPKAVIADDPVTLFCPDCAMTDPSVADPSTGAK